jgi:uncharacterized protein (DUF302 family)
MDMIMPNLTSIGFEIQIDKSYEETLEFVINCLKLEGFGVLTRIDVKETLQEKLDLDFRPYSILGACNPPLAHRALSIDPVVGLLLPCNVTVEADGSGKSIVRIANPEIILNVGSLKMNNELQQVALEAKQRLERVAEAIAQK